MAKRWAAVIRGIKNPRFVPSEEASMSSSALGLGTAPLALMPVDWALARVLRARAKTERKCR
jgi:hypothetical protein